MSDASFAIMPDDRPGAGGVYSTPKQFFELIDQDDEVGCFTRLFAREVAMNSIDLGVQENREAFAIVQISAHEEVGQPMFQIFLVACIDWPSVGMRACRHPLQTFPGLAPPFNVTATKFNLRVGSRVRSKRAGALR